MAKQPDWERIESEFRAGVLSVSEIARQFGAGITHQAIFKKAKAKGWKRDLSKKVQSRAKQKLVAEVAEVAVAVAIPNAQPSDEEIIEAAANQQAAVIKIHRTDIKNARELVSLLSAQLKDAATLRETIEDMIFAETEHGGPKDGPDMKRRGAMLKAVSLPAHAGTIRDLSTALKNLVALERQAFNIEGPTGEVDDPLTALLKHIAEQGPPGPKGYAETESGN